MAVADRPQVQSFGRRSPEPEQVTMLPPIMLPKVHLPLELDHAALLQIGDRVRETIYNAAMAGLLAAVEDFARRGDDVDDEMDGDSGTSPG